MTGERRFGIDQAEVASQSGSDGRRDRVRATARMPWPRFLLTLALQIAALLAAASLFVWLMGR